MKRLLIALLFAFPTMARTHDWTLYHPNVPTPKSIELDPPQTNTFCASNLTCTVTSAWTFSAAANLNSGGALSGIFSGPTTLSGSLASNKQNNVIQCDGVTYTGISALQSAITALPIGGGTVDCSNPLIGNQTLTSNPFAAAFTGPVKVITGPYTVQYDATAFFMDLPHDTTIQGYGTIWLNSTAQSLAALVTDTSGRSAQQQTGILNNRIYGTTGSITTGTATLTVASASFLRLGQTIAVLGAAGAMTNQNTTINQGGGIAAGDTSVTVVTTNNAVSGKPAFGAVVYQDNYLLIDSEIVSFSGLTATSFTGLSRGLFGTTAASHLNGATVSQLSALISEITAISGTTITLADNASFTVTTAPVQAGAMNIIIDGNMTFDNNYVNRASLPSGGSNYSDGIAFLLGSQEVIGPGIRFQNSAHGGSMNTATRKSRIGGSYRHIGRPPNNFGSDVWLFASSVGNIVETSAHADGDTGVFLDDRSDTVTRWAGGTNDNVIVMAGMTSKSLAYTTCYGIEGFSSHNIATLGYCNASGAGFGSLELVASQQWSSAPTPSGNVIYFSALDSAGVAINSSGGANNQFRGGTIATGTISLAATDSAIWQDKNDGATRYLGLRFAANNFVGASNSGLPAASGLAPTRSSGNPAFPDLYGDGTHAVVLAGTSGGGGEIILGSTVTDFSPGAANATNLGTISLPYKGFFLGTASTNNFSFVPAATAASRTINIPDPLGTTSLPLTIASGTKALNTASITTATCDGGAAATATGTLSTDTVDWSFNAAPTATNKYGAFLVVYAVPSTNTVTFYTCNPSATTSTPTAMTVNFSVRRP